MTAIECISPTIKVIKLQEDKEYPEFKSLNFEDRQKVKDFVKAREKIDNLSFKMIHLESSVQLVFYLVILLANLNETPLIELNYNESTVNVASTKWILGLLWLLLKTGLSGYTTFSPIFMAMKKNSYKSTQSAPSIFHYVVVVLGVIVELMFSGCVSFLS